MTAGGRGSPTPVGGGGRRRSLRDFKELGGVRAPPGVGRAPDRSQQGSEYNDGRVAYSASRIGRSLLYHDREAFRIDVGAAEGGDRVGAAAFDGADVDEEDLVLSVVDDAVELEA